MEHSPTFTRADFTDPRLHDFLSAHLADLAPTAPAESRHALDLSGLQGPHVRVWVAELGAEIVATGALSTFAPGQAELKSMRSAPQRRGTGLGRAMLQHLVADARSIGVGTLWLETGSMEFFVPARALYESAGFRVTGPFSDYVEDPNSVFMTMTVPAPSDTAENEPTRASER